MTDPSIELMRLISGYQVSQALYAAATLGVADQLKDGAKPYDAVAQACGAHPLSLYRLLRALAAVGVFHESDNKEFSLTALGVCLTTDGPGSTRNYARWIGQRGQWGSWGNLLQSIKSGESALGFTYGTDAWTYRMQHPDEQAVYDSAMTGNSRREAQGVLEAFDFGQFGCVVDIGGGQGLLLKTILLACPGSRGILFDQPQVIASADQALSSPELRQRCQLIAGSFFESVPTGGDVYLMKVIIHDWDDRAAIDILRTCHRAMSATATLILVERVIGPPNEMPEGKFSDLNMMVVHAAMERTRQDFDDLLRNGGFKLKEIITTRFPQSLIIAQPMSTD
jgi:hypothetical protein